MKLNILLLNLLIWLSLPVLAGNQIGKVDYIVVRASDGLVLFNLSGSPKSYSPTCATNSYWMIKDENSEVGKKQYAMLLAAQASGRNIDVAGMNTCTRWSDGEDVNSLLLRGE